MHDNLAARAGRWSAAHWKTATFGWLALVVVAVVLGTAAGTKKLTDAEDAQGESARAEQILADAGFRDVAGESVLVQSRRAAAGSPAFKRAVAAVVARLKTRPEPTNVRRPAISKDRRSALVQFDMKGPGASADKRVQPVLDAVAGAQETHPAFTIEEFGDASANHALNETIGKDFSKAERLSVPLTFAILLLAFGAFVAAGVPVLLAFSAVLAAIGLSSLVSHVQHASDATGRGPRRPGGVAPCGRHLRPGGSHLRSHRADRDGRHALRGLERLHVDRDRRDDRRLRLDDRLADGAPGPARKARRPDRSRRSRRPRRGARTGPPRAPLGAPCGRPPERAKDAAPAAQGRSPRLALLGGGSAPVAAPSGRGCRRLRSDADRPGSPRVRDAHEAAWLQRPAREAQDRADLRGDAARVPGVLGAGVRRREGARCHDAAGASCYRRSASPGPRDRRDEDADPYRRQRQAHGGEDRDPARRKRKRQAIGLGPRRAAQGGRAGGAGPVEGRRGRRDRRDGRQCRLQRDEPVAGTDRVRLRARARVRALAADVPLNRDPAQGDRAQPALGRRRLRRARLDLPGRAFREPARLPLERRRRHLAAAVPVHRAVRALDGLPRVHPQPDQGAGRRRPLHGRSGRARDPVDGGHRHQRGARDGRRVLDLRALSTLDIKQMGVGLAVAVILDATIIRGVLLPATMKLLGRWNWYLPRSLQWLPRLNVGRASAEPAAQVN